jgi:hypothetical protein
MMGLTCEPPAPLPPEPGKPVFTEIKLKVVKDALGDYMEGVHLSWAPPETIPVPISFYYTGQENAGRFRFRCLHLDHQVFHQKYPLLKIFLNRRFSEK